MKNKLAVEQIQIDRKRDDICSHQFFKIADEVKREGEMVPTPVRWGVKIMCGECGERRILWTDGEVEICQR